MIYNKLNPRRFVSLSIAPYLIFGSNFVLLLTPDWAKKWKSKNKSPLFACHLSRG
jgi:hypothetical protein